MSTVSIGGFRAGLLERLFTRADQDQSQSIGAEELAGLMSGADAPTRARTILDNHDLDGDDQLSLVELTAGNLAPEALSSLLTRQEYAAADRGDRVSDDDNAVDDFFAHADSDGDGRLSRDEFDAERILRMAQSLDTGETAPQHFFAVMPAALEDDVISRDEIMLGRRLTDVAKAVALDDLSLDPKLLERLKDIRPLQPGTEASTTPRPDTATALGNAVRNADLTQTLVARLIKQLEMGTPQAPIQDLTA